MSEPVERIRERLHLHSADAVLLTSAAHVRWASGFTGSNAIVLVTPALTALVTDPRYTEQAAVECPRFERFIAQASLFDALRNFDLAASTVIVDSNTISVAALDELTAGLPQASIQRLPGILNRDVAVKQPWELDRIASAQALTDEVFRQLLPFIKPGVSERRIAAEVVYLHLKLGASEMSFAPIVASGSNGAFPHARPSERTLEKGDPVVIDMGCVLDGYCSDMTRTVVVGRASDDFRSAYGVVLQAKREAIGAAHAGMKASELDAVAREVIDRAELGDYFVHSLGHGVGLQVHEWPRIGRTNDEILPAGAVVTIEPGVYIPQQWGIRVEDLIVLAPDGCRNLTSSPDDLLEIAG